MGLRLLSYMVQIWMEERREWQEEKRPQSEWRLTPILPIVFYTGKGEWKSPLGLTALMDLPEVLTRFIPTFNALFLDVKATAAEELTQTGHPLGWLLTVLQQEHAEDPAAMRQALLDALTGLRDLQTEDPDPSIHGQFCIFSFLSYIAGPKQNRKTYSVSSHKIGHKTWRL